MVDKILLMIVVLIAISFSIIFIPLLYSWRYRVFYENVVKILDAIEYVSENPGSEITLNLYIVYSKIGFYKNYMFFEKPIVLNFIPRIVVLKNVVKYDSNQIYFRNLNVSNMIVIYGYIKIKIQNNINYISIVRE